MTEMATAEQTPNLYALLIGVDYYKPNLYYRSLKGCVRDINLVENYLKRTLNLPAEKLWKLTSPNPEDPTLAEVRSAQPERLPTYENIVTAFQEITAAASPNELVYIHYSGHGGRSSTIYPELAGKGEEDEGLVPMDLGDLDGRYLRDVEFATLLKRMTDKGLLVTVILDSCHSGGATRGDCEIRGAAEVDTAARSPESLVAPRNELIQNWLTLTDGSPNTGSAWVPKSRDYVLLAACRPSESAYEYAVNGKERHGALTYWMIDTLTSSTSALTYKALHDRVNAKIQSKFPAQLPMLMGEGDRAVFGSNRLSTQYTVSVMKVTDQQVTLNAGLAQGLSTGTRFAIYPLNSTTFSDKQKQIAIVEVTEVEASRATAQVLTAAAGGIEVKGAIEQGAPAVMISAPVDLVRRVRLFDQKQAGSQEHELPPDWVDRQTAALETVRQALDGNGWVVEVQDGEEAHYQVAIGSGGEYEICIGMPLKNLGAPLMVGAPDSATGVVNRLIHLAKYQAVQELDNAASDLTDALEFELLDKNKQPFPDASNLKIKQGEVVHLRVKNTSAQALNVAVLDLEPTWAISQIPLEGIEEIFYQLGANQEKIRRLRPALPSGENYKQAKETLKLFATKGLADFRWLNLSPLDEEIDRKGNLDKDLAQKLEGVTRGEAQRVNPLNALLATVGADLENAPTVTRAMVCDPDPNAEWVTKQIQLTIDR
jgi:Caspase domain